MTLGRQVRIDHMSGSSVSPPGADPLALQQRGEHGRFADLGLTSRGEQCQLAVLRKAAQMRQSLSLRWILQLQPVATAEFREADRVVAVPLTQLVRRCDMLAPLIERRLGLG